MRLWFLQSSVLTLTSVVVLVSCSQVAVSQSCLNYNDVKMMTERLNTLSSVSINKELRNTLLKLNEKQQKRLKNSLEEQRFGAFADGLNKSKKSNDNQVCALLKEFGWPTLNLVGRDGVDAAFALLKNSSSFELQRELLPLVLAANQKGEIPRRDVASYIDRVRLSVGLKQLFGTEATISKGFVVLYPIDIEAQVDWRREQYGLPPLRDYVRTLERTYQLPLIKSPAAMTSKFVAATDSNLANLTSSLFTERRPVENDVISVDINLVNLVVGVFKNRDKVPITTLEQKDFAVFEDDREETLSYFANTDVEFDLVLLLDLSGSTSKKRELIQETTRRFIEVARPSDHLAIVTFSETANIISPLTIDRKKLQESIGNIEGLSGQSNVWQALDFTLKKVLRPKSTAARRAVVFMTDGADSQIIGFGRGLEFSDLLETVGQSEAMIIPIYLDTEGPGDLSKRVYKTARDTLSMLAEESGGLYYKASKLEDLREVYPRVIEYLGNFYSLGYMPTNSTRDGSWRGISVKIRNQPDLFIRTKRGYYAK